MDTPSNAATYERAVRLANIALWTVALQRRRLRSKEPEDGEFFFRKLQDFQFMIVALTRLRRAAVLASKLPLDAGDIGRALKDFDTSLPTLKIMRNVAEHFDEYALDKGRHGSVRRRSIEIGTIADATLHWLDCELNADVAMAASRKLFSSLKAAKSSLLKAD